MADHYETLGVGRDADAEQVKRAYRKKAQRAHPDRGGTAEQFRAVVVAYEVLSNDARRARYDRGEQVGADYEPTLEERANKEVASMIVTAVVTCPDVKTHNLVRDCQSAVERKIATLRSDIATLEAKIAIALDAAARISRKGGKANIVGSMIDGQVAQARRQQADRRADIELCELVVKIFAEYDYRTDENPYEPFTGIKGISPELGEMLTPHWRRR